jgi:hypothetical protein
VDTYPDMEELPGTIDCLTALTSLHLDNCSSLRELLLFRRLVSLRSVHIVHCNSLMALTVNTGTPLSSLHVGHCSNF